ncbi:MAG: hypothetical protein U0931_41900 [Vulcanimicrobiota bacterium]
MSSINFRLPQGWDRHNCQSIDEAKASKRCQDIVRDVSLAVATYSDTVVNMDNQEGDYCPDVNRVIALRVADRYGDGASDVDLTFSQDKARLLGGEIRTSYDGYQAISKVESADDGSMTFSRTIEHDDGSTVQNEQNVSVQVNADGTLTMLSDMGRLPGGMSSVLSNIHVQSRR